MAEPPKLLELLGQQLQPMEILDETDAAKSSADSSASAVEQILECQKQFYVVLTASNDESKMKTLFEDTPAAEVDEVPLKVVELTTGRSILSEEQDPKAW
jgi:hypothetical protein